MFVNFCHNGVLSPIFSPVSASASPSAFPLLKVPNKRNVTGLVCGSLTGFECFIACDCVNWLDFPFEKREVVSTIVQVFDEFIGA